MINKKESSSSFGLSSVNNTTRPTLNNNKHPKIATSNGDDYDDNSFGCCCSSSSAERKVRQIAFKIGLDENSDILHTTCLEMKKEFILHDWQLIGLDSFQWKSLHAPIGLAAAVKVFSSMSTSSSSSTTTTTSLLSSLSSSLSSNNNNNNNSNIINNYNENVFVVGEVNGGREEEKKEEEEDEDVKDNERSVKPPYTAAAVVSTEEKTQRRKRGDEDEDDFPGNEGDVMREEPTTTTSSSSCNSSSSTSETKDVILHMEDKEEDSNTDGDDKASAAAPERNREKDSLTQHDNDNNNNNNSIFSEEDLHRILEVIAEDNEVSMIFEDSDEAAIAPTRGRHTQNNNVAGGGDDDDDDVVIHHPTMKRSNSSVATSSRGTAKTYRRPPNRAESLPQRLGSISDDDEDEDEDKGPATEPTTRGMDDDETSTDHDVSSSGQKEKQRRQEQEEKTTKHSVAKTNEPPHRTIDKDATLALSSINDDVTHHTSLPHKNTPNPTTPTTKTTNKIMDHKFATDDSSMGRSNNDNGEYEGQQQNHSIDLKQTEISVVGDDDSALGTASNEKIPVNNRDSQQKEQQPLRKESATRVEEDDCTVVSSNVSPEGREKAKNKQQMENLKELTKAMVKPGPPSPAEVDASVYEKWKEFLAVLQELDGHYQRAILGQLIIMANTKSKETRFKMLHQASDSLLDAVRNSTVSVNPLIKKSAGRMIIIMGQFAKFNSKQRKKFSKWVFNAISNLSKPPNTPTGDESEFKEEDEAEEEEENTTRAELERTTITTSSEGESVVCRIAI